MLSKLSLGGKARILTQPNSKILISLHYVKFLPPPTNNKVMLKKQISVFPDIVILITYFNIHHNVPFTTLVKELFQGC